MVHFCPLWRDPIKAYFSCCHLMYFSSSTWNYESNENLQLLGLFNQNWRGRSKDKIYYYWKWCLAGLSILAYIHAPICFTLGPTGSILFFRFCFFLLWYSFYLFIAWFGVNLLRVQYTCIQMTSYALCCLDRFVGLCYRCIDSAHPKFEL